jgi:probable F420-dependent oxidoreductase
MKISVVLPIDHIQYGQEFIGKEAVIELAQAAEAAGYDACAVTDHPAPSAEWLDSGGHYAQDPFVMLAMAAAVTQRIMLQTFLMILPYRNPFIMARGIASLDVSSGGRVIMAVGAGYLKSEFKALGVDFDSRNETSDEALQAMITAWTNDEFSFEGTRFSARRNRILPRPLQQPHPPIWVGGNSHRAIRRAVDYCQGWIPFYAPTGRAQRTRTAEIGGIEDYKARLDYMRDYARQAGKPMPQDLSAPIFTAWDPEHDNAGFHEGIARCRDLGANWIVTTIPGTTRAGWIDNANRLVEEFRRETAV